MKGWEIVNQIKVLTAEGRNVSEISRKLNIDRKTVRKYRDMDMHSISEQKKRGRPRAKKVGPFQQWLEKRIDAMVGDGFLNAQALYHEAKNQGYMGSARTLRRFVARYRKKAKQRRIYKPFETDPGYQAMVDFGEKRKVRFRDRLVTVYFASMVLSHSRRKFVEWYDRPIDLEMFLEFHQNAFRAFEGIPEEIVYDQTKLVVLKELYGEVEANEAFYNYADQIGFKVYLCNSRDPETKGKVEAVIKYAKRSFLPGRHFENLTDLIQQWEIWLRTIGDAKVHETTGKVPLIAWEEERHALMPFTDKPIEVAPSSKIQQVYKDGLVKVLGNRYSVPYLFHGQKVRIRVTGERVEIYTLNKELLWSHWRCFERRKRILVDAHYEVPQDISTSSLALAVQELYQSATLPLVIKKRFPRHVREQYKRLLALQNHYAQDLLQAACERAMACNQASYQTIKGAVLFLAEKEAEKELHEVQLELNFNLPDDLGIQTRDLSYYDQIAGGNS